jgi:precorrin-6B methylase 2
MHYDAKGNEASRYTHLRKALDYLDITPDDVFVDFGCGKGRVLAFAAIKRPRRVVGVELVEKYAEIARANAHTLTRKLKVPVEVRTGDAAFCSIDDGTIYYLFNPFGTSTLQSVLDNIRKSLETNPRRVRIAYYNPSHEVLLGRIEWLEKVHQIQSQSLVAGTISISIWQNKLLPGRDREASVRSSESLFPQ